MPRASIPAANAAASSFFSPASTASPSPPTVHPVPAVFPRSQAPLCFSPHPPHFAPDLRFATHVLPPCLASIFPFPRFVFSPHWPQRLRNVPVWLWHCNPCPIRCH